MVKRGLGRQAPAVLAAPRRSPGVLTKPVADASLDELRAAVLGRRIALDKLTKEHEAMRDDLGTALDGWEAVAGAADQARIDALRKRWGITAAETAPDDQDLTDATAER